MYKPKTYKWQFFSVYSIYIKLMLVVVINLYVAARYTGREACKTQTC